MPITGDRDMAPTFLGLKPRVRLMVTDSDGSRRELLPGRDRVCIGHRWVATRPEMWEPVGRMDGQDRGVYQRALVRTRSELAMICGRAADQLERSAGTSTRTTSRARGRTPLRLPNGL